MLLNHCRLYAPLSGGFAGEDCCVELDGGKITAVGPARPDTAEAFDCGGQTLLPGLIDLHTHITFLRNVGVAQAHDPMQLVVEAAAQADRYLRHGFTTIRDCGSIRRSATYLSEATTDLLLASEDSYLVPTLAAMYVSQTDPHERSFWLSRLTPMLEDCAKTIGYAYRAGAVIGFGTDSVPMSPQYDTGVEFRFRKEYCGMENLDILLQATKNSALIAGLPDVGEIKAGMKADLILVAGDPAADLSAMYVPPVQVWKNGIARK